MMLEPLRFFEIAMYSILGFVPYIILAIYPFRRKLRFSIRLTAVLIIALTCIQVAIGVLAATTNQMAAVLTLLSTLIYGVFYFIAIKANIGKMVFTLLMLSNISNFIVISAKCFEGAFFPELAQQAYRWSFSIFIVVMQLIVLTPVFIYTKKIYSPAMRKETDDYIWRFLWLIPATFYLLWFHNIYYAHIPALELALQPSNSIFLLFIDMGAFLVYHVVIQMAEQQAKNIELEVQNHQLAMQSLQYENLQNRIAETRRRDHDIRHHMTLMAGYVESGDQDRLKQYLHNYLQVVSEEVPIIYCEHYAVNMLIFYFSQLAKKQGIKFDAAIGIPAAIGISDSDISVLLGNLLENAIEACSAQHAADRRIVLRGSRESESTLVFTVDNTCENKAKKNSDGIYLSSKHVGTGIGIESVKDIVFRNGGICKFEQKNGMFYASIMLVV